MMDPPPDGDAVSDDYRLDDQIGHLLRRASQQASANLAERLTDHGLTTAQYVVLARLAELDVLRHVEVLSCVSGGSIIGGYYYLELRHLLEVLARKIRGDGDVLVRSAHLVADLDVEGIDDCLTG